VPLDWAATQMNLGNALSRLGERAHDRAKLEVRKAVNAAFEVYMQAGQEQYRPPPNPRCRERQILSDRR
jgi:hypothetical protein